MTTVLAGADIRGYYEDLGIQLPGWAQSEATVRCFAQPDLHQHDDRDPSTSINLQHGAYHCHGCGARGGAYDAALERGHSARGAIELMIQHALIHRRIAGSPNRPEPAMRPITQARRRSHTPRPRLADKEAEIRRARRRLSDRPDVVVQLADQRGWSPSTLQALELGLDEHQRVTIPVRTVESELVALLRYRLDGHPPKLVADRGSRRVLYPCPAALDSHTILLVEGEPDRIAAHSHGLPAVAIPGADAWHPNWGTLFGGRRVLVALDADQVGRSCAQRVRINLTSHASSILIVDLAPDRDDGYDLTDWLNERPGDRGELINQLSSLAAPTE